MEEDVHLLDSTMTFNAPSDSSPESNEMENGLEFKTNNAASGGATSSHLFLVNDYHRPTSLELPTQKTGKQPSSLPETPIKSRGSLPSNLGYSLEEIVPVPTASLPGDPGLLEVESCRSDKSQKSADASATSLYNKKRKPNWYHALSPTYKSKMENFRRVFRDTAVEHERLLVDYACAYAKTHNGFLMQGRMYITENFICFYSKIISFEQKIILPVKDVIAITKERTAKVFPNAIQIELSETKDKYFFTSFGSRDKTYSVLHRVWQNRKDNVVYSPEEFWEQVHEGYGDDLGLTSSDDDYVCPTSRLCTAMPRNQIPRDSSSPPPNVDENASFNDNLSSTNGSIGEARERPCVNGARFTMDEGLDVTSPGELEGEMDEDMDELPTDQSDTTEDEDNEEELICSGHEHFSREYVNEVFYTSIDALFTYIFTDSEFFVRFSQSRKTYDMTQSAWPDEMDENGEKERTIYYTLTLNNTIGPRTSSSVEKQVLLNTSVSNRIYIIDAKVRNGGVPYCDSFHVVNRYCLTHVTQGQCRFRVSSKVVYDKTIFFPAKGLIENSAKNGLADYFQALVKALHSELKDPQYAIAEADQIKLRLNRGQETRRAFRGKADGTNLSPKKAGMARPPSKKLRGSVRRHGERGAGDGDRLGSTLGQRESIGTVIYNLLIRPDRAWFTLIVLSLVLCLCLSVLYSRFVQLENLTQQIFSDQRFASQTKPPVSQAPLHTDWAEVLNEQSRQQASELKRWKTVVDTTIKVIDEMKASLINIRQNIESLEKRGPSTDTSDPLT